MNISYNKLWKKLIDRGWKKKDLVGKAQISSVTIAKLGKNLPVNMDVLIRICDVLDCDVGDIVEFVR